MHIVCLVCMGAQSAVREVLWMRVDQMMDEYLHVCLECTCGMWLCAGGYVRRGVIDVS
jgi:hypothetical protein